MAPSVGPQSEADAPVAVIASVSATDDKMARLEAVLIRSFYSPHRTPILMLISVTGSTILPTIFSGALTIALPTIGKLLNFTGEDLQWPLTMFSLSTGALLLIMGALADALGRRLFFFIGLVWIFVSSLALSFVQDSLGFIVVSALLGVGGAILQPPATGLLSIISDPKLRNYSYSALGAGQPVGFILGLMAGGFLSSRWRIIAYMLAGGAFLFLAIGLVSLPSDATGHSHVWNGRQKPNPHFSKLELLGRFDWLGASLSTVGLVLLTFALADAGSSSKGWKTPFVPAFLPLAVLCLLSFGFWEVKLERKFTCGDSRIAPLLPHSIWKTPTLKPLLGMIFLLWLAFNTFSFYATLWIQEVQQRNSLHAAVRFLPMVGAGILFNIISGVTMNKVHGLWLIAFGGVGSAVSCLVFALMRDDASYWAGLFPCFILTVATDLVFPPAQLYACEVVGPSRAALAGGLFSTTTRLATSFGLALSTTISSNVTKTFAAKHASLTESSPESLARGYQAAMWFCFACCIAGMIVSFVWLREIGIVGCKEAAVTEPSLDHVKERGTAGTSLAGTDAKRGCDSRRGSENGKRDAADVEGPVHDQHVPSSKPSTIRDGSHLDAYPGGKSFKLHVIGSKSQKQKHAVI